MKFNSIEEASVGLSHYINWRGVIYPLNLPIKGVFVGTSDEPLSKDIWRGIQQEYPAHKFSKSDLENIEYWCGYPDGSIKKVAEIIKNDFMRSITGPNKLRHEITITNEWSKPYLIPKGLHIVILFKQEAEIISKIMDYSPTPIISEKYIKRDSGGRHNISYNDLLNISLDLVNPEISFKLKDTDDSPKDVSLLFVDIMPVSSH